MATNPNSYAGVLTGGAGGPFGQQNQGFNYPGSQGAYRAAGFPQAPPPTPAPYKAPDYSSQFNDIAKQIAALSAAQYKQQYVPAYDLNANLASARSAAAGAVNPLYVKKLNDYLAQEKINQERKQQDVATANTQLQESLTNTLQGSQIDRGRTAEDTQNNINQVNTNSDQFQADSGQKFNTDRTALAGNVANSGLTTSGLGAQTQDSAQAQRNQTESRQGAAFQQQKAAQQLAKTRTFEDLARSDTLSQQKTKEGTEANTLDLNRYLQDLTTQEAEQRQSLEASRLADISAEQGRQSKMGVINFANTLSGQSKINFLNAYGGLF